MARDNNTYAKRQRDMQKKQKAQDKRTRRDKRKEQADRVDHPASDAPPTSET
jgi:hypothetical protein